MIQNNPQKLDSDDVHPSSKTFHIHIYIYMSSNLLAPIHVQAGCPTAASADDPHGLQASFPGRF